ncbi:MAG TPA: hypothetical protein VHM70_05235 [Polyangiaceae bacterium]|jgi:hypothetical protein|nr:hypothetical protein [Polyangiaceae bacterium]
MAARLPEVVQELSREQAGIGSAHVASALLPELHHAAIIRSAMAAVVVS